MNIGVDGYHRNADSPVSDNGPDYAGESTELETEDENSPKKEGENEEHEDGGNMSGIWADLLLLASPFATAFLQEFRFYDLLKQNLAKKGFLKGL